MAYFADECTHYPKYKEEIQGQIGLHALARFFFDRIGWLGAAGLIDVDYVLAPMQHTMRRVWTITEPMIRTARVSMVPHYDPVYLYGFEWARVTF